VFTITVCIRRVVTDADINRTAKLRIPWPSFVQQSASSLRDNSLVLIAFDLERNHIVDDVSDFDAFY